MKPEELAAAGAPRHSNRFMVNVGDKGQSRIIFGDAITGTDAIMHTHVIMSTADLETLAATIDETLRKAAEKRK